MGAIFPLFSEQMFSKLTYHWGNTLFACIATLMIPIPFVSNQFNFNLRLSYLTAPQL